jgi:uncharacterized tellurite resistance protein B-like protein
MINALKKLISKNNTDAPVLSGVELKESYKGAAALLIEAALADGEFDAAERLKIQAALCHMFGLPENVIDDLLEDLEKQIADSNNLYGYSRIVKTELDYEQRVLLIQMLWEVVYADGELDDFESNLLRRLSGLLYVSDQDSGRAKKLAMKELGINSNAST